MSTSFTFHIVRIINIATVWILYPLHLACFLWSIKRTYSSSNRGLCCFNSHRTRLRFSGGSDNLFSVLPSPIYVLTITQVLSKTTNLSDTLILNSGSFSFPKSNLSTSNLCVTCLLTVNLSLNFATYRQWSVSQSAPLTDRASSTLECHLLSVNMW
jgi:hypothetical protein